jgi:hypothetical protein
VAGKKKSPLEKETLDFRIFARLSQSLNTFGVIPSLGGEGLGIQRLFGQKNSFCRIYVVGCDNVEFCYFCSFAWRSDKIYDGS